MVEKKDLAPFDQDERAQIRQMMEEFERFKWFFTLLAKITVWVTGVITFIFVAQDFIARVVRGIKAAFSGP